MHIGEILFNWKKRDLIREGVRKTDVKSLIVVLFVFLLRQVKFLVQKLRVYFRLINFSNKVAPLMGREFVT